jgi:hypothetical protein
MTFEQFMYFLDAYGASFHRWPEELREAAEDFAASSPAASAARAEVARLDALLDRAGAAPDRHSERRLVARARTVAIVPPRSDEGRVARRTTVASFWPRAVVLAVVALLGIVTGTLQIADFSAEQTSFDLAQTQSGDTQFDVAGL